MRRAFSLTLIVMLVSCTLVSNMANAQQFGGNPPLVKWKQVNTPEAKIIFPAGLDSVAVRVANVINQINPAITPTIGTRQKQVSIVLQNQTTIPNAYVGLAPFRSEFFLTPQQNSFEIGSYAWAEQLAIHEYRHVQQYNNFNVGASKVFSILFGQGGQALGNELSIPNWFFEGDAVMNETLVSRQGRGRIPYFYSGFRGLWQAGKDYSWMKLRNGSYCDYVPNHYELGYMMVSYGREKYGADFWRKVTYDAASFTYGFYPFQKAVKHHSNVGYKQFRKEALTYFKSQFNDVSKAPNGNGHFIANQEYPAYINDSSLVYMKSTYDQRAAFVMRKGEKEQGLRVRDISIDNYFAYHNGKIVYASYRPDRRWTYRNFSELQLLDVATGKQKRLTKASKYFAPDFSPDGTRIVAVEAAATGDCTLHLLSADNGKILTVIPNPQKLFYTYPKFYGDDKIVSAARDKNGKMSLTMVDIASGESQALLDFGFAPIGFLAVKDSVIYFSASGNANEKLYSYNINNQQLLVLNTPDVNIGNYQPAIGKQKLAYTTFTASGYQIREIDRNTEQWQPATVQHLTNFNISALNNDPAANLLASVTDKPLNSTKYPKAYKLFNFHSLIPDFNDPNYQVSLESENILNTFRSSLSFNYNRNEGYKQFGFSGMYAALFPIISAGVSYTADRRGLYQGNRVYWNETEVHGGFQIPLAFSKGRNVTGLNFGSDWVYNSSNFQSAYKNMFRDRAYTYLNNFIILSNRIQQARKNIYTRFGQTISLNYKRAITGLEASQFLANGYLYLPGIGPNHHLVINGAYQQRSRTSAISFSNGLPFSRGYEAENLRQLKKAGVNYAFPIAYPDAGFANTIYFMRLRGNLFYDYTHANDFYTDGSRFSADFRSTGAELFFDTKWFNQVPISFGVRYSHLLDRDIFGSTGKNRIELIVPLSIF